MNYLHLKSLNIYEVTSKDAINADNDAIILGKGRNIKRVHYTRNGQLYDRKIEEFNEKFVPLLQDDLIALHDAVDRYFYKIDDKIGIIELNLDYDKARIIIPAKWKDIDPYDNIDSVGNPCILCYNNEDKVYGFDFDGNPTII